MKSYSKHVWWLALAVSTGLLWAFSSNTKGYAEQNQAKCSWERELPPSGYSQEANQDFLRAFSNLKTLGTLDDLTGIESAIGFKLQEKVETSLNKTATSYSYISPQKGGWWNEIIFVNKTQDKSFYKDGIGIITLSPSNNVCIHKEQIDNEVGEAGQLFDNGYHGVYGMCDKPDNPSYKYNALKVKNGYFHIHMYLYPPANPDACLDKITINNTPTAQTGD